jgi:heptosyltransferase-2
MLGDVLTSTIIADQLKLIYPVSHIDYLIISHADALVLNHPSIDGLIKVGKSDVENLSGVVTLSRKLKAASYDLVIDSYGKNSTALLTRLTGAKVRLGYKKWFAPLVYTESTQNSPDLNIFKTGISLGSRLLLTTPLTEEVQWDLKPKIHLTEKEKFEGKTWISQQEIDLDKPITMVSALGSSLYKTLPFNHMAQVLNQHVLETNSQLLFNYIPSQKSQALKLYNSCLPKTQQRIFINAFAPSIRDFLKVLNHCTAIIGNEGGAINMGKALGIPTFTIFSPWINKQSWNAGEDEINHVSVHLNDFKPELYDGKLPKKMKAQALELYKLLNPYLFAGLLNSFDQEHYGT